MNVEIAKILWADIVTTTVSLGSYDMNSLGFWGRVEQILPEFSSGIYYFLRMKWAFANARRSLAHYSLVFLSNEAITAWRSLPGSFCYGLFGATRVKKIYYAHSVSRHLYDQRDQYLSKIHRILRPLARGALVLLRRLYESDLGAMDRILTNSETNAGFLRQLAPQVDVRVLYPYVDTEVFTPSGYISTPELQSPEGLSDILLIEATLGDDYFISYARLSHAKRVDRIILAFRELPDAKLLVIFGKNDPQREEFTALAAGYPNIVCLSLQDNSALPRIVRGARAMIYISQNEDFGMNTIESLASGVPVIAVAEGGFLETMVEGETGILLDPTFTQADLQEAIASMTPDRARAMRDPCRGRAMLFSREHFKMRLQESI